MKTPNHITKLIAVAAAALLLSASPASAVIAIITPVGFAFGQTARVNLLNTSDSAIIIIGGKFVDNDGGVLGEFRDQSIAPGRTMSFDLNRNTLPGRSRVQFHVVLEGEEADLGALLSSLEVFNNATGKTTVFVGNPDI